MQTLRQIAEDVGDWIADSELAAAILYGSFGALFGFVLGLYAR
jgi:hypothetical protein